MSDSAEPPLVAIYSDIGRGHPSYLDSVIEVLARHTDRYRVVHLADLLTDREQRAWRLARTLYRLGGTGGITTALYNAVRNSRSRPANWQLRVLGRDLRQRFAGFQGTCLVEHPLVARILAPVCRTVYLHAEIAAPAVAAVVDADRIFAPLEQTAARLKDCGVRREALTVTGLVVEPELARIAESAFEARLIRYRSDRPLTVGLFTSGAYPRPHLDRIVAVARSLAAAGHRPLIIAGTDRAQAERLRTRLTAVTIPPGDVLGFGTRQAETTRTIELFPQLDLFVAAAHERTGWAVGLGLPLLTLLPHIGPFARENHRFALEQVTCLPLRTVADASGAGDLVSGLRRSGELERLTRNGFGTHPLGGAERTADSLLRQVG